MNKHYLSEYDYTPTASDAKAARIGRFGAFIAIAFIAVYFSIEWLEGLL